MSHFHKYENNPVFGNTATGTTFDAYVWKDNGRTADREYIGYAEFIGRDLF